MSLFDLIEGVDAFKHLADANTLKTLGAVRPLLQVKVLETLLSFVFQTELL